jgi:hypothetical protein
MITGKAELSATGLTFQVPAGHRPAGAFPGFSQGFLSGVPGGRVILRA